MPIAMYSRVGRRKYFSLPSIAALFLLLFSTSAVFTSESRPLWFVDHKTLKQFDSETHEIGIATTLAQEARAIAVDPKNGNVWALTQSRLERFDHLGSKLAHVGLRDISKRLPSPKQLALNAYDGSLWVGAEKVLLHITREGQKLIEWEAPGEIEALALDLDESLWLLTHRELLHLSNEGTLLARIDIKGFVAEPDHLAIDSLGSYVWVAAKKALLQFDGADLSQPPKVMIPVVPASAKDARDATGYSIDAIALHPVFGTLWAVSGDMLSVYDRQGVLTKTVSLATHDFGVIGSIAYDPHSASFWLGGKRAIGQFTTNGEFVSRVAAEKSISAIAVAPFKLQPTVTIAEPADGSLTNNPRPTFRLQLGASCSTIPCLLLPSYIESLSFDSTLNGFTVGNLFGIRDNEATYIPPIALPEGLNTFSAVAKDLFGHSSEQMSTSFTVDTIPPVFLALTPADGTVSPVSAVTIAGQVDDQSANVTLSNSAGQNIGMAGATFSFAVVLQEGINGFTLAAFDPAGNITTRQLAITFQLPLSVVIQEPEEGATIAADTTVVSGTFQGPQGTTVTVNGETATISAGTFSADVALAAGSNAISVLATSPDGRTASAVINVTRNGQSVPPDPATVAPPLDPTVAESMFDATAFLYTGNDPIQTGVALGTIEKFRVAILRGKVMTRDGNPLPGVEVTIHDHPEFGQTISRYDGMFDLAVNGGSVLTVNYRKSGFLSAQRQVDVPWRKYVIVPEAALIVVDPQVTTVALGAAATQVAHGSVTTDDRGTRKSTLLFSPGTKATMTLPDGTTQNLSAINVRATEYTVGPNGPTAMPAELPPTSGYTYAVELSVDEATAVNAKTVTFDKPVYTYVDNFIHFPVGAIVPSGYYDREKAAWIASNNGKVIKILNINGGIAAIDANGDGNADTTAQLAALGITEDECITLATIYPAEKTLWRVPVRHFTPWDFNWPYGPGPGAGGPEGPGPDTDDPKPNPTKECGSVIECQNQVLGERVKVVGTTESLHYSSHRVPGRIAARSLMITLSGPDIWSGVNYITLHVQVEGQTFSKRFPPLPNQKYEYIWDGRDAYGRMTHGQKEAVVSVTYTSPAFYYPASEDFDRAFARTSEFIYGAIWGQPGNSIMDPPKITIGRRWRESIGVTDERSRGLGAWTLTHHHRWEPEGDILYFGNGERRDGQQSNPVISTYSYISSPLTAIAVDAAGNTYVSARGTCTLYKISRDGDTSCVLTPIIGGGGLSALAVDRNGNVFIADEAGNRIRKLKPDGTLTTFAGNGGMGITGDGGPATSAQIGMPTDIALDRQGNLYIAAHGNAPYGKIRKVSPDGIITSIAGKTFASVDEYWSWWWYNPSGEGTAMATAVYPKKLQLDEKGNLFFTDHTTGLLRKLDTFGKITAVQGAGEHSFNNSQDIAIDAKGNLFFADSDGRVRRLSSSSEFTVFAGNGIPFSSYNMPAGDGGPALKSELNAQGVTFDGDGNLLIADWFTVRKVSPSLPGTTLNDDVVASSNDGAELYYFNSGGRHLRTVDALTGITLHSFDYDSSGYLTQITDKDLNVTRIERTGGIARAIVAPDGQRTDLSFDANGYLAAITNPANETHNVSYTEDGLLVSFMNPRGHTSQMFYDPLGRLTKDENAGQGGWTLSRATTEKGYEVKMTSALNRTTTYRVEQLSTGDT